MGFFRQRSGIDRGKLNSERTFFVPQDHVLSECIRSDGWNENEIASIRYGLEIHQQLKEMKLDAYRLPLIYLGSGGDLFSALAVSGSQRIFLIDPNDFYSRPGEQRNFGTYSSFHEVWEEVVGEAKKFEKLLAPGQLEYWNALSPVRRIVQDLQRLGVQFSDVSVEYIPALEANLTITFPNRNVITVTYIPATIGAQDISDLLSEYDVSLTQCGIFLKASAGEDGEAYEVLDTLIHSENANDHPAYFITDDPRAYAFRSGLETNAYNFDDAPYTISSVPNTNNVPWGYNAQLKSAQLYIGVLKEE
ncbi:hypothetical protein LRY65_05720 [Candidatus Woesebacteria bacterium]|nr:hypothetical protein [Candidatus Woesebacteria bacterium]MCD8506757.1 hypothetical protein [Candidatus Woesebacteria bacterium]MCD8527664.1 hypothetical protein [Candidatus Woesebacteria bacterium]MCD8546366.1 hypothetical protein [Candidatus Woesebacteria bacterium]